MKISIVGPGAVGKTTVINYLTPYLDGEKFVTIQEREEFINNKFDEYMKNMKGSAFETQKTFFVKRFDQIERMQDKKNALMDRHLIDDFIFPRVHIQIGNFSKQEAKEWEAIESKFWKELKDLPRLDIVFILLAPNKLIEERRENRSKIEHHRKFEVVNHDFFREVNKKYHDRESILYKAANEFAKKVVILENENSESTAKKIKDILIKAKL